MKVFVGYDRALRVRIGHENLGSESLGPCYGGTGALRLRQVSDGWFFVYRLDDHAPRGTSRDDTFTEADWACLREHLPSMEHNGPGLTGITISADDLAMLQRHITSLRTTVVSLGDITVQFGDFDFHSYPAYRTTGLFHLGDHRFNGFRWKVNYLGILEDDDLVRIIAQIPSAQMHREGEQTIVEINEDDFTRIRGAPCQP